MMQMDRILIVSSTEKSRAFFKELMQTPSFQSASIVENGAEARRILIEADYDIIVINAPLSDETGKELALDITRMTRAGVILMVKADYADAVSAKVEDYGVFVVGKPVNRQLFYQSLRIVSASRRRMLSLQSENTKLHQKIQEIRLVDRAKCTLIQYLHMTEQDAHRYIEKQAMDLRMTRREIAEEILKTYES